MESLGTGRRRSDQIPANRRPGPAGRGRRTTRGVPRLDFDQSLGQWWRQRGLVAASAVASRGAPCSGEVEPRQQLKASDELW
jgi:hypothetical protein